MRLASRRSAAEAARRRLALLETSLAPDASDDATPGAAQSTAAGSAADGWTAAGSVADGWTAASEPAGSGSAGSAAWESAGSESARGRGARFTTSASPVGFGRHAAPSLPLRVRLLSGLADRLPPRMRSAMDGTFSGHHLGVLAVVLAVGLALTAWWVLSGRPEQQSVPPVSLGASAPATPSAARTSASPTASTAPAAPKASVSPAPSDPAVATSDGQMVVVDVAGKVRRPGIVTLPAGSRVADALKAAGGPRPGVDLVDLNLARLLTDGEQILVGVTPAVVPTAPDVAPSAPSASPSASVPAELVNLNTAGLAELETLPGVGPVTAQAIVDWRTENGGFTSVDELIDVDGIGEVTLAELRDLVTV